MHLNQILETRIAINSDRVMKITSNNLSDDLKTKLLGNSYAIGIWVYKTADPTAN